MEQYSQRDGAKYIWQLPGDMPQAVLDLARSYTISVPVMHTLYARGMTSKEQLDAFLFSTCERDVTHPSHLKDAEKAVERILRALTNKEKILICGDYDVDGITSSAMMMACLLPLGAQINFFLPHRVHDGYGLSVKTVQRAAQNNYKVLVTVDNGISAFDAGLEAQRLGLDLIITDHHKPHPELPCAYAIINPHQDTCLYPYKMFAGVGVIFKIMSLLYEQLGKELPSKVYELLTLGTIADVVPLTGENRFWVRHGLHLVNKHESLAMRVLKKNARFVKPAVSALDIGFSLTPQLNALGRLEDARDGVAFLIAQDEARVERIGTVLKELNEARRGLERKILQDVENQITAQKIDLAQERIIVTSSTEWQPGVIGLVASRLVGSYNRPAILLTVNSQSIAKGSCRSVPGFNIFEALSEHKDLLTSFGGHAQAAGLSLPFEHIPELKKRLEKTVRDKMPLFQSKATLKLDATIHLEEVNKKLMDDLAHLEPFGHGNNEPVFYVKDVSLIEPPKLLKEAHTKLMVFSEGTIKPVIFFNRPDIFEALSHTTEQSFSLAVQATENHFNGRVSVELHGVDIAL
jgi:single-stranded-DNA-specific exonuclease